ncbi:hypothetical protein ACVGOW_21390 [Pseudonocardia saturnea]
MGIPAFGRRVVERAFAVLARFRSGRALHTRGVVLDALLVLDPGSLTGAALGGAAERPAVVRMSKSVSLPGNRADLLGVGLRVPVNDRSVLDVLLASVGRHDLDHILLLPSTGWWSRPYSTLLPYRIDGRLVVLGLVPPRSRSGADPADVAVAVAAGPVTFTVTEKPLRRRRREIGWLTLTAVRERPSGYSFDPVLNSLSRLRPVRLLSRFRELAYTGSRRGRRADPTALLRSP